MKGVILAAGQGTRLLPITKSVQKVLLPVWNKPLIFYSLEKLVSANITEIAVVIGSKGAGNIMDLLEDGADFGTKLTYVYQDGGGVAKAIAATKNFAGADSICVMLGDNIMYDDISNWTKTFKQGALVTYKEVTDSRDLTSFVLDSGYVTKVIDSRMRPEQQGEWTPFAYGGIILFDSTVFQKIGALTPSKRGELEIIDVFEAYIKENALAAKPLLDAWFDVGNFKNLLSASVYVAQREEGNHENSNRP